MRKKENEITDRSEIDKIIKNSDICRMGLSDENKPYIVPMNFGYKNNCLYFHCAKEGKKIDIIRKNPYVCFEFDLVPEIIKAEKACNWGIKYKSVIGFGKAFLVKDLEEKENALRIIMSQYTEKKSEFSGESVEKTGIIIVEIESITGKQSCD
ncbi:pyridoxamine 5'-phosphate oxidase family protein [Bacteroidota bacterium]